MPNIIKLSDQYDGAAVYINADHITLFHESTEDGRTYTSLTFNDQFTINVKETPSAILKLVNDKS